MITTEEVFEIVKGLRELVANQNERLSIQRQLIESVRERVKDLEAHVAGLTCRGNEQ